MIKTEEIIKYEQTQRLIDNMNRVTRAVADFGTCVGYDRNATELVTELYKMSLGYLCDAIIELDEINNVKTKTVKRKVK